MTSAMEEPLLGRLSEKCSAAVRAPDRRTSELRRTGTGTLSYAEEEVEQAILSAGAYGGHHSGTTRMSARPEDGVVDADCRVHGTDNLYIASTSVLPTSSQANPTLTGIAMALRLADHLCGQPHFHAAWSSGKSGSHGKGFLDGDPESPRTVQATAAIRN